MSQLTNEMNDEEFEANHKKEASKILQELNEAGFEIVFISGDFYIRCKNPDYQPNNCETRRRKGTWRRVIPINRPRANAGLFPFINGSECYACTTVDRNCNCYARAE